MGNRRKRQHGVSVDYRFDLVTLLGRGFDNQKAARPTRKSENEITSGDQTFRATTHIQIRQQLKQYYIPVP